MKKEDSNDIFGFEKPIDQSSYQPIVPNQNNPVEEEEYSIFEKISSDKPASVFPNPIPEESKEDMVMQIDTFFNQNNSNENFDLDGMLRQI